MPEQEVLRFPSEPAPRLDVEPIFAALRDERPVVRVQLPYGGRAWLVTRYADVRTVLSDRRLGRAGTTCPHVPRIQPEPGHEGILMSLDPPEHTRLRRAVSQAFSTRRVEALRREATAVADRLIDTMVDSGPPADLVASFALPLPMAMISGILGVPPADRGEFKAYADTMLSFAGCAPDEVTRAQEALRAYVGAQLARRRRTPTADLLGGLARAQHHGELTESELIELVTDLLVAGYEPTAGQLTNFTYELLRRPADAARLRADPRLIPAAVEELLRYVSLGAGGFRARVAQERIELDGVTIEPGETVFAPTIAANRDRAVFDDADALRLDRVHNPHLSFGHGIHRCLGAPLARMELQVALRSLLRRLPNLSLAEGHPIVWKAGPQIRGPRALPVTW